MQGGAGELAFLGTGVMISNGSPSQEYLSILDENGQVSTEQSEGVATGPINDMEGA